MTGQAKTQSTPVAPSNIAVAIVEDERDIRESLTFLVNGTTGYSCAGSYRTMEEAIDPIGPQLPDVALSDIGLPGMDGIVGLRILQERLPDLLILLLTVYDDHARIFDAIYS